MAPKQLLCMVTSGLNWWRLAVPHYHCGTAATICVDLRQKFLDEKYQQSMRLCLGFVGHTTRPPARRPPCELSQQGGWVCLRALWRGWTIGELIKITFVISYNYSHPFPPCSPSSQNCLYHTPPPTIRTVCLCEQPMKPILSSSFQHLIKQLLLFF